MKSMITEGKKVYLETPLVVLHRDCLEWMEEIAFWKVEVSFLYKLVKKGIRTKPGVFKSAEAKKVEKQLIHLSAHGLDEWSRELKGHEKFLGRILKKPKLDEKLYRAEHKKLASRFRKFELEYKRMKKKIFILALRDGKKGTG